MYLLAFETRRSVGQKVGLDHAESLQKVFELEPGKRRDEEENAKKFGLYVPHLGCLFSMEVAGNCQTSLLLQFRSISLLDSPETDCELFALLDCKAAFI